MSAVSSASKITLFLLCISATQISTGDSLENERISKFPFGVLHGTAIFQDRNFITRFANAYGDDNGMVTADLYVNEDESGKAAPIVVIVDVADTRDVAASVSLATQQSPVINVHVKIHSVNVINELKDPNHKWSLVENLQNVLLWINKNAVYINGDKSRVAVIGLGPDGSRLVSALSLRDEAHYLLNRGILEFGEYTVFSINGWLESVASSARKFKVNPAPRELLVGYDRGMEEVKAVTGTADLLEAFGNHGCRITLFERTSRDELWNAESDSLFSLWFQFSKSRRIEEAAFPQMSLASWRNGINILSRKMGHWRSVTAMNLLQPRAGSEDEFPVKNMTLGTIRGRFVQRGVYEAVGYYHIPYAKKISRFEYPSIVDPWTNLLDARYPVPYKDCTQTVFVNFGHEDCLNLHLFIPRRIHGNENSNSLPVMVFMHGGSFNTGGAGGFRFPGLEDTALYDGTAIADHAQVIVVSVNYRLGPLGFLNDGDTSVPGLDGNYGMRDMVLAFEWVNKYITEFGGDPAEVTLFGESAGAAGTAVLALSPMMNGLIKRHIQESGSSVSFFAVDFNPRVLADQVTTEMGCRSENYTKTRECLMQRDEYDFMQLNWPADYVPWRPTIDGSFLVENPAVTLTKPSNLDLLIGFNSDEVYVIAAAILPKFFTDEPLALEDVEVFRLIINDLVLKYPDRQQYITDIIFHNAAKWEMDFTTQKAKEAIVRASSDYVFAAPSIRQTSLRSQTGSNSTNYVYNFDIKTKLRIFADWTYNSHAFELPYVFGEPLRKTEYDPVYNATQDLLSLQMITYWTNFAKSGNPNSPMTSDISAIPWDEFTEDDNKYMRLDFRMTRENLNTDYRKYELELWNFLLPSLLQLDDEACTTATTDPLKKTRYRRKNIMGKKATLPDIGHHSVTYEMSFVNDTDCNSISCTFASTTLGTVQGFVSEYLGVEVESFLGIPYAEPPIGDLRFRRTQPAQSWGDQVLDATKFMPDCPWNSTLEGQSEDCLYLNIYRPKQNGTYPVLVWIHPNMVGGVGASAYEGRRIAAKGKAVVVTFNYRVGALGFLSAGGESDSPGNFGLLDQNMVLQWVNLNIREFGGSPSHITLFGDRDSSVAAGYHAVSTLTKCEYFTNIIHQSGVGQLQNNLPDGDLENAQSLAVDVSCSADSTSDMIACLRQKTIEELMAAADDFQPQVVKDAHFFTDQPVSLFENGDCEYAYLIAFTDSEGSNEYDKIIANVSDRESFKEYIRNEIVPNGEFLNPFRIRVLLEYEYMDFEDNTISEEQRYQRAAMNMHGDKHVVAPSMSIANLTNRRFQLLNGLRRNYVCKLTSAIDDEFPSWVGSAGGSFAKLFWGLLDSPSPEVERLSDRVVAYWTTFADKRRPFGILLDDAWLRYDVEEGHYGELVIESDFALHRQYPRPKYSTIWNILIPSVDKPFPCEAPEALAPPEVTLHNSQTVRGYADRADDGRAYHAFRGLPYAEPPLGNNRFRDSVYFDNIMPSDGDSVYHATFQKPRCLQTENGVRGGYADEDCLYLDIWKPEAIESGSPVLIWICHGGTSVNGPHGQLADDFSCDVDGRMMALDGNLIFVKIQYRIGILGFASTESSSVPGNAAISDIRNGVQWVFKNIELFGGNKEEVSLGGVGFGSTLALVVAGMSRTMEGGTVQSVIAQSGALNSLWAYSTHPRDDLRQVYEISDCSYTPTTTDDEAVQCLRDMDALKLIKLAGNVQTKFPFGIYIKNTELSNKFTKTNFLSSELGNYINATVRSLENWLKTMHILTGISGAAGYRFTLDAYPEIKPLFNRRRFDPDLVINMIDNDIYLGNFGASYSETQSQELENFYIPWGSTDDGDEIRRSAVRYHTEGGFTDPMYDMVNSRINDIGGPGQRQNTFVYVYQVPSDARRTRDWLDYGGDLGEEIPLLFPILGGDESTPLGVTMRRYWGAFATRGNPNPLPPGRDGWSEYNLEEKNVMIFEHASTRTVSGYRDQAYAIWNSVLPLSEDENSPTTCNITNCNTEVTCPTISCTEKPEVVVTSSECPVATCPEKEVLGTGIGLELTPSQADSAIEALFGISLAFLCLLIIAVIALFMKSRKTKDDRDSLDDFVLKNEAAMSKQNEAKSNNFSSL